VVTEDVLLCSCQVVATGRLQGTNLVFRHVNEQREIGRISPEADCRNVSRYSGDQ
jgi:hypothetical protein